MLRAFSLSVLTSVCLLLVGCNATPPKRDPAYAPLRPVVVTTPEVNNGAIYQAGYEKSWFEDLRARRVGDMLTVQLVEKTQADKKAKTSVDKQNNTSIANPTILGSVPQFDTPGFIPLASNNKIILRSIWNPRPSSKATATANRVITCAAISR